jgi:hypothetical protein
MLACRTMYKHSTASPARVDRMLAGQPLHGRCFKDLLFDGAQTVRVTLRGPVPNQAGIGVLDLNCHGLGCQLIDCTVQGK